MRLSLVSLFRPSASSLGASLGLTPSATSLRRTKLSPYQQLALLAKDKKFANQNEARRILLECKQRRDEGATEMLSREMFRAVNEICDPPLALSVLPNLQSYGIPLPRLHLLSTSDRYSLRTLLAKIVLPPNSYATDPLRVSATNLSLFLSLADKWLPNDPFVLLLALRGWDSRLALEGGVRDLFRRQEIEKKVLAAREGWFKKEEGLEELEGNGWHFLTEKESEIIVASVDELRTLSSGTRPPAERISEDLLSSWDKQPCPASKVFHLQRMFRLVLRVKAQTPTPVQPSSSSPSSSRFPHSEISTFLLPLTLHSHSHSHSPDPFISLFSLYLYSLAVDPDPSQSEGRNNLSRFRRELEGSVLGAEWHPNVARNTMERVEGLEGAARWCLDEMLKEGLVRERERAAWEGCLGEGRV